MSTATLLFFNADAFLSWLLAGSGPVTLAVAIGWATWFVRGFISDQKESVKNVEVKNNELSAQIARVDERVTVVEKHMNFRFDEVDLKIEKLDLKIEKLDSKIEKLETKFDAKFEQLETKFDAKFERLETKFDAKFDQIIGLLLANKKSQE